MTPAFQIHGLKPYVCTYYVSGVMYGVTLYAESPEFLLAEWSDSLPGLEVEGVLIGTEPHND